MSEPETHLTPQEARQGKGGVRLTMILAAVLILAVLAYVVLHFAVP